MITILIISCVIALVAYRFQQEVQAGYQFAQRFEKQIPELYVILTHLLGQDPLKLTEA